jgi:hypothetical protein
VSRKKEFEDQVAAIKKATPKGPLQSEKAAAKTQGSGG